MSKTKQSNISLKNNSQWSWEQMFNISYYWENTNQNHNEFPPHTH